jgi:hypothetical protein
VLHNRSGRKPQPDFWRQPLTGSCPLAYKLSAGNSAQNIQNHTVMALQAESRDRSAFVYGLAERLKIIKAGGIFMTVEQIPEVSVMPSYRFLYSSRIEIDPPLIVGQSPYGERRIINIKGGAFSGPRLSGRVLPGGADWQIIRPDGITEVEARYTLETQDGALIYVYNRGLRHGPPEVIARMAAGEDVDPREYYFRTTPVFETGVSDYVWLNGIVAIATGQRQADEVIITVYEVT